MFGDFILWFREKWKQFWCIHDYQYTGPIDYRYEMCTKCGRLKN